MSVQDAVGIWGPAHFENSQQKSGGSRSFWATKRLIDIFFALLILPIFLLSAAIVFVLNPFYNPGPLFFVQERMGRNCQPFRVIKMRSMLPATNSVRRASDPLETDRITPLGGFLRKARIDELPQVINVLRGDMSLIGPRPDSFEHACEFAAVIPHYARRHSIRPGISGLAQVTLGYIEGVDATRLKATRDLHYIRKAGFRLEAKIFWMTLKTVFLRLGS